MGSEGWGVARTEALPEPRVYAHKAATHSRSSVGGNHDGGCVTSKSWGGPRVQLVPTSPDPPTLRAPRSLRHHTTGHGCTKNGPTCRCSEGWEAAERGRSRRRGRAEERQAANRTSTQLPQAQYSGEDPHHMYTEQHWEAGHTTPRAGPHSWAWAREVMVHHMTHSCTFIAFHQHYISQQSNK